MAHVTPQFDLKTGADSQLFFSREVTASDVGSNGFTKNDVGKIVESVSQEKDTFNYPQLTRRTGHSIKGSTETIESSELRKGRTKSAPRKGNSSSEGSLDIELSPETYDDIFEAALRGEWHEWKSDSNSPIKFDYDKELKEDQFISNGTEEDGGLQSKYLVGYKDETTPDRENAVIVFESKEERDLYEIDELCCEKKDVKYSGLTQYGGIEGQDLYQEFEHLAVNTMSLSVSPGQIVTGSFGFMGANNPDLLGTGDAYTVADPQPTAETFPKGKYFKKVDDAYVLATEFVEGTTYYVEPTGIINALADDEARNKEGRFYDKKNPEATKAWVDDLANKTGTGTDQFTAREGFLFINGHRVQYGSNLSFELNNGLKQIFAIFEKGSISTTPLSLDITGTLDAYLIKGYSEELYNMATGDKDVEVLFCFQDKEDNPDYMYVVQIFKTKFTDTDISQGSEELTVSLPFTSFGERACRFFRIRRKVMKDVAVSDVTAAGCNVEVALMDKTLTEVPSDLSIVVTKKRGADVTVMTVGASSISDGMVTYAVTGDLENDDEITVKAMYKAENVRTLTKTETVAGL